MSTSFSPCLRGKALLRGMGSWLNVGIVCWGRQRVGSRKRRKMFNVPEIFMMVFFRTCMGML